MHTHTSERERERKRERERERERREKRERDFFTSTPRLVISQNVISDISQDGVLCKKTALDGAFAFLVS
jgi:hypothetical protein